MDRAEILKRVSDASKAIPELKRSAIVYQHMRDPALLRYYYKVKTLPLIERLDLSGSSPTDIFVGRFGYPKVFIGPMVPPEFGDTSILSTPERWRHKSIEDIVDMRYRLVRGMYETNVHNVEKGRIEEQVRDLALAERPADSDIAFARKPFVKVEFRDEVQPFGPSAQLKSFEVHNMKADRKMESMYSDTDATATTSILELYERGLPVSQIQKGLSAGLFGLKGSRRFVPTRWSITAVDDTLGKHKREHIKEYDSVDAIYAFYHVSLDNRWLIFFIPGNWQYESIEAWWPKTVWNANGIDISIFGSYEGYNGRSTYAEIGGCYYAARLAVTERLELMKRQAMVLILREVHDGYIMPVGVWNVREHVREALGTQPTIMHTRDDMFNYIRSKLSIPVKSWIANSTLLDRITRQRSMHEYMTASGK